VRIKYSLSAVDLLALSEHHSSALPTLKAAQITTRWVGTMVVYVMVVGVASLFGVHASLETRRIAAIVIGTAYFFAYPYLRRRSIQRQINTIYPSRDMNRGVLGDHELELQPDEGLIDRTSAGEYRITWDGIDRIEADAGHLYIYLATNVAHVVPKAGITDGDYDDFTRSVQELWRQRTSAGPRTRDIDEPRSLSHRVMERVAGAILLSFGLGLAALAFMLVERQLTLQGALEKSALVMVGVFGLIAVFCTRVGYRLAFNRPNRQGSLLPPLAWLVMAGLFGLIGLVLLGLGLYPGVHLQIEPALLSGFFAWLCWQAGQIGRQREMKRQALES
jgi:hypothetical protein